MLVTAAFKYYVPRLKCKHEGEAQVLTFQLKGIISECRMNKCASSIFTYDKVIKFFYKLILKLIV